MSQICISKFKRRLGLPWFTSPRFGIKWKLELAWAVSGQMRIMSISITVPRIIKNSVWNFHSVNTPTTEISNCSRFSIEMPFCKVIYIRLTTGIYRKALIRCQIAPNFIRGISKALISRSKISNLNSNEVMIKLVLKRSQFLANL